MASPLRLATESIAGQRPYQEDAVLAEALPDGRTLVAVADGMGGHAAGEVASALALETLKDLLERGASLGDAFRGANDRVRARATEPGKEGMGTTLVALLIEDDAFRVANVGDSRAYLLSAQAIRRLTEDHSFVAEAIKHGQSESEAMDMPWRDALTRSVGTEGDVEVDEFGPFSLEQGTALLVCSDGLYKTLRDEDLRALYARSSGPEAAAQTLVSAAYDGGSDDNISVAVVEVGDLPREVEDPRRSGAGGPHLVDAPHNERDSEDTLLGSFRREPPTPRALDREARAGRLAAAAIIALMLLSVLMFGG